MSGLWQVKAIMLLIHTLINAVKISLVLLTPILFFLGFMFLL